MSSSYTLDSNLGKLKQISEYKKNWNGHGADPIPSEVITSTRTILYSLSQQPFISPTARDTIQLEYEKEKGEYLEFEVSKSHVQGWLMIPNKIDRDYTLSINNLDSIQQLVNNFFNL